MMGFLAGLLLLNLHCHLSFNLLFHQLNVMRECLKHCWVNHFFLTILLSLSRHFFYNFLFCLLFLFSSLFFSLQFDLGVVLRFLPLNQNNVCFHFGTIDIDVGLFIVFGGFLIGWCNLKLIKILMLGVEFLYHQLQRLLVLCAHVQLCLFIFVLKSLFG